MVRSVQTFCAAGGDPPKCMSPSLLLVYPAKQVPSLLQHLAGPTHGQEALLSQL